MIELLKRYKFIIIFLCIPYLFLLYILISPVAYEVDLPGDIRPVEDVIEIDNVKNEKGSFNTTFVISYRNTTIFQKIFCQNYYEAKVYEINKDYLYITNEWAYKQGEVSKESSIYSSIIAAYSLAMKYDSEIKLDYNIIGRYVYDVSPNIKSSDNEIKVGDVVKGETMDLINDNVSNYLNGNKDYIEIYRKIDGKYQLKKISPTILTIDGEKKLGISLYWNCYQINNIFPKYKIKNTNIGGNSGGLMQALSIFNSLTDIDYTFGLTIAGTGAIDALGNVSEIGAIEQKIYTAQRNNCKIFFVPKSQYDESLKAYNKIKKPKYKLIAVSTLNDAIDYLLSLEGGNK